MADYHRPLPIMPQPGMRLLRRIRHVVPGLPSQRHFYALTGKYKGFSGPIASGKTYALCQEALRAACRNPGCPGLIGGPTYPHLHDVTITTLVDRHRHHARGSMHRVSPERCRPPCRP